MAWEVQAVLTPGAPALRAAVAAAATTPLVLAARLVMRRSGQIPAPARRLALDLEEAVGAPPAQGLVAPEDSARMAVEAALELA